MQPLSIRPMFESRKDFVSFLAGLSAVLFTLWLVYKMIFPFFPPLLLAYVTAISIRPIYIRLLKLLRRPYLTASTLCLLIFLLAFVPLVGSLAWGIEDLRQLFVDSSSEEIAQKFHAQFEAFIKHPKVVWLIESLNINPTTLFVRSKTWALSAITPISKFMGGILANLPALFLQAGIYFITLAFVLAEAETLQNLWRRISPFPESAERVISREFRLACKGAMIGTILSAFAQGAIFTLTLTILTAFTATDSGAWIVVLGTVTLFMATIPFLGAAIVWVPTSLVLFLTGDLIAGIGLFIVGATVISATDNVIKILALKDSGNLHPLWAFLTVIGGIEAFGVIGVLLGPIFGALVLTILRLFRNSLDPEKSLQTVVNDAPCQHPAAP